MHGHARTTPRACPERWRIDESRRLLPSPVCADGTRLAGKGSGPNGPRCQSHLALTARDGCRRGARAMSCLGGQGRRRASTSSGPAASLTPLLCPPVPEDRPVPGLLGLAGELDHHVLDPRVLLEGVHRHVLAEARLAKPAVWHLARDHQVVVDEHVAEIELDGRPHRRPQVAGPDRAREAVSRVVRHPQCLLVVLPFDTDEEALRMANDTRYG